MNMGPERGDGHSGEVPMMMGYDDERVSLLPTLHILLELRMLSNNEVS